MTKISPPGSPPHSVPDSPEKRKTGDARSGAMAAEAPFTTDAVEPSGSKSPPSAALARSSIPAPPAEVTALHTIEGPSAFVPSGTGDVPEIIKNADLHQVGSQNEYSPSRALRAEHRIYLGLDPLPVPSPGRSIFNQAVSSAVRRPPSILLHGDNLRQVAPPRYREVKKSVDFNIQTLKFARRYAEPLGFIYDNATQTHMGLGLDNPNLAMLFLRAPSDLKRSTMQALATYNPTFEWTLRSRNFSRSLKQVLSIGINAITGRDGAYHVRADIGFMLMLARNKKMGRHFGAAIVHSQPKAVEAMLELIKDEKYIALPVLTDSMTEIASLVVESYHSQNVASLKAAGLIINAFMHSIEAGKGKQAGNALSALLNELSEKRAKDDPIRGCLVGIYIAGALTFSEQITARDKRQLEVYMEFNEALWGGLASITFPGVPAVTKVLEIATREIITNAYTVRDFKGSIMAVLADIKMQVLHRQAAGLNMTECLKVDDFIKSTLMHWIDVALNANGYS